MCIPLSRCRISSSSDLGWGLEIHVLTGIPGDCDAGVPAETLIPSPKSIKHTFLASLLCTHPSLQHRVCVLNEAYVF